jgi:acyl carrier protein
MPRERRPLGYGNLEDENPMTQMSSELDQKLQPIFVDVFGISPAEYREDLDSDSLEAWDSVQHLTLVLALEQAFGVQFTPEEIGLMKSVPAIKAMLDKKGIS